MTCQPGSTPRRCLSVALRPGQGRPGDAGSQLQGAAGALASLGEAGGAPAGEARFYEALSAAGYAAASEAGVLAAEPALREVMHVYTPLCRCCCLGKGLGALGRCKAAKRCRLQI